MEEITIVQYDEKYAPDFKQLNIEWIEKYFVVEPHDLEQLSNPTPYIINKGGYIVFALHNGKAVGTCALIKTGEQEFELAKMAVSPVMQGKQVGKLIGLAVIEKAKEAGAKRIWLESNRILTPAINLYRRLGFVEIPSTGSLYARADIKMEMLFG